MTVRELIEKLSSLPQDLQIITYNDNDWTYSEPFDLVHEKPVNPFTGKIVNEHVEIWIKNQ